MQFLIPEAALCKLFVVVGSTDAELEPAEMISCDCNRHCDCLLLLVHSTYHTYTENLVNMNCTCTHLKR